jgi:hypothetical protein
LDAAHDTGRISGSLSDSSGQPPKACGEPRRKGSVGVVDVTWTRRLLEAFFAVVSVVFGHVLFGETVPSSTWLGLSVILAGSAVVQFGAPR